MIPRNQSKINYKISISLLFLKCNKKRHIYKYICDANQITKKGVVSYYVNNDKKKPFKNKTRNSIEISQKFDVALVYQMYLF